MWYRTKIIIVLIIAFNYCATTANTQTLSVEQCIDYAMEHNVKIANSELNIELNEESLNQSKRNILPSIMGNAQSNVMFGKSIDPTTNDFVNERLFSTSFYLGAEIDLFKGLTNKNYIGFRKTQHFIASEQCHQEKINTAFAVMANYYNVLYYKALFSLANEQVALSEQHLRKAQILVDIGLKPTTEILEMEAQLIGEEHNTIYIENLCNEALLNLKNSMYYPIEQNLTVDDTIDIKETNMQPIAPNELYAEAVEVMPTTKISNLEIEAQKQELKMARGQLSPTLSLGASYSTYYADSRKEALADNPDQLRTITLQNQLDQNASENIYLSLRIPIFQKWQRMSQIQTEKIKLEMAINNHEEASQQLYKQISLDLQQLNSYRTEITQLEKKRDAEKQALAIIEKKLEKGLISVLEFYTAKNNLMKTKAELLRAKTMLLVKRYTIDIYTTNNKFYTKDLQ